MNLENKYNETCYLVKDLLPLYSEDLVGKETEEIITIHLEQCVSCKEEYAVFCNNNSTSELSQDRNYIDYLKTIRFKMRLKYVLFFIVGIIMALGIFMTLFVGIFPTKASKVSIDYSVVKEAAEDNYSVTFNIAIPEGEVLNTKNNYIRSEDGELYHEVVLYRVFKLPFDDRGSNPNMYSYTIEKSYPFDETDRVIFRFIDGAETYSLKELAEEAGIQ